MSEKLSEKMIRMGQNLHVNGEWIRAQEWRDKAVDVRTLESRCEAMEAALRKLRLEQYLSHICDEMSGEPEGNCAICTEIRSIIDIALSAAPSPGEGEEESATFECITCEEDFEVADHSPMCEACHGKLFAARDEFREAAESRERECAAMIETERATGKERDALAARVKDLEAIEAELDRRILEISAGRAMAGGYVSPRTHDIAKEERDEAIAALAVAESERDSLRAEVERLKIERGEAWDAACNAVGFCCADVYDHKTGTNVTLTELVKKAIEFASHEAEHVTKQECSDALAAAEKRMGEAREKIESTISNAQILTDATPCTRSAVIKRLREFSALLAPSAGGTEGEGKAEPTKSPFVDFEASTLKRLQECPDMRESYFEEWDRLNASPPPASATDGEIDPNYPPCPTCKQPILISQEPFFSSRAGGYVHQSCPALQPATSSASEGEKPASHATPTQTQEQRMEGFVIIGPNGFRVETCSRFTTNNAPTAGNGCLLVKGHAGECSAVGTIPTASTPTGFARAIDKLRREPWCERTPGCMGEPGHEGACAPVGESKDDGGRPNKDAPWICDTGSDHKHASRLEAQECIAVTAHARIAALESELAAARERAVSAEKQLADCDAQLIKTERERDDLRANRAELAERASELEAAREALKKYGRHRARCHLDPCDCGLDAALSPAPGKGEG